MSQSVVDSRDGIVVNRGIDCRRVVDDKKRVAVRRRSHDRFGGDIAVAARPVLDDELLTESLRKALTYQASENVGPTASRKADDNAHRLRRIGLRGRNPRDGRKCGSPRCQMQKLPAQKFHDLPAPEKFSRERFGADGRPPRRNQDAAIFGFLRRPSAPTLP
jgi:hypothetical protein